MQARYGLSSGARNAAAAPLVVASIVMAAAVAGWFAFGPTRPAIQVRLLQWEQSSPSEVRITYAVTKPAGAPAYCAVRTQDRTRVDTGFAIVPVPAAPDRIQQSILLTTLAPMAIAEVLGCASTAADLPSAAFPPGVAPPAIPYRLVD